MAPVKMRANCLCIAYVERTNFKYIACVLQSCIKTPNKAHLIESLDDGEKVMFDTVHDSKGDEAINVTGINGAVVVGSEHAPRKADTDLPSWAAKLVSCAHAH